MPAANTKHTWLAAIAASILRPMPDTLRMLPYGKSHGNQFPNLFGKRFPSSWLPAQGDRRPLLFQCPSRVQPATAYCPRLSEARLAKHISSLRRTACRPKSVRLHTFYAASVVDGCGISCGNGRGWLRRSRGKTSSKPAASVVDQLLTNVRG